MAWSRGGAAIAVAALCVALLPGRAVAAIPAEDVPGSAPAYRPAADAVPIEGTASSADGPELERAGIYTDTIGRGQKKYYRVQLDDTSNAFVSTVLAPPPGSRSGILDGIRVSLASTDGTQCGTGESVTFGGESTRPVAGYASRRIESNRPCQQAGEYLYTVEWAGAGTGGAAAQDWPIELTYMAEPGLKPGAADPQVPTGWSSKAPSSNSGTPRKATGGTGFNDAAAVDQGAWRDDVRPGESRFYKVPVAWGQQLFLRAQLANSASGSGSFAVNGLRLALYNTARGQVADKSTSYTGAPTGLDLGTAPAAYANRSSSGSGGQQAMRFQGWYYIQVSLDPKVPSSVPLTLDVDLKGTAQAGPAYDGDAEAAGFGLADTGVAAGGSVTMRVVGIAGIGIGTVLVLGLGAWYAIGRRGRRSAGAHAA
ncbi:hypothetical protein [Streptomyces sp. NPDC060035]|uniref:hypothetical protein n=1 Tax=Streptomyces sp. NPDC060035 TaxID=3347044 RepID=UPI0036A28162